MKARTFAAISLVVAALLVVGSATQAGADVIDVTQVTYELTNDSSDPDGTYAVNEGDLSIVDGQIKLVSFTDGTTTWDSFVLADSVITSETDYSYGQNATDPGSAVAAITDDRVDTWLRDAGESSASDDQVYFPTSPASLDYVLFIFELTGGEEDITLVDSNGDQISGSNSVSMAQDGAFWKSDSDALSSFPVYLEAVTFGEFGITEAQLSDVAGINIGGTSFDPMLVGYSIPEPATMSLLAIGGLGLLRRRRR